jgi:glycosyltransferase involved in cell wall biosynthesis
VRESLIETARRENLQNVSFEGYVDESTLFAYIRNADIVCNRFQSNPYGDIGVGNKAAEAAFMSKAMLSVKSPAVEELFTDSESALLFEPGSSEAVVRRVTEFYETDDRSRIESNVRRIYDRSIRPEVGANRMIENVMASQTVYRST